MIRKIYLFDDGEDNYLISITEEQKKVFEWFKSKGYDFNLKPIEEIPFEI